MIRRAGLALLLALAACGKDKENVADRVAAVAAPPAAAADQGPVKPAPPVLQSAIEGLARGFDGDVGIAVKDLQDGWTAQWQGMRPFPQQSCMKVWLGVAVMDAVDRGALSLDEAVLVRREDMSIFNQPMRFLVDDDGYPSTVGQLLHWALQKSDNAATDILMRRLGGGAAVQAVLDRKGLQGVEARLEERVLQPRVSGLEWTPEYLDGDLFNRARDKVPEDVRRAAWDAYVRDPMDGATPIGTVNALAALKHGRLLSPGSSQQLLQIMAENRGGRARLKAGVPEDWIVAHKTGTGPDWRRETAGYNDVGLLIAPDGRSYAVAVYIARTDAPIPQRQQLMAEVARLVAAHDAEIARPAPEAVRVE